MSTISNDSKAYDLYNNIIMEINLKLSVFIVLLLLSKLLQKNKVIFLKKYSSITATFQEYSVFLSLPL